MRFIEIGKAKLNEDKRKQKKTRKRIFIRVISRQFELLQTNKQKDISTKISFC